MVAGGRLRSGLVGLFLVVVLACLMTQSGAAQEAGGGSTHDELQARYDALFQRMLNEPGNLDVMFEFAGVATQLGEYEPAISTLERMLIFNPDLPRVRLELGALYFRMDAYSVAEAYFAQVADDPEVPESVRRRVAEFREEIAKRSAPDQFAGVASLGVAYQSNATGGPADATVRVLGLVGQLDDEFTAQEDYNLFLDAAIRHTHDLGTRTGSWLESTARAYVSRQLEQHEVDLVFLELTTGPRLALTEEGMRGPTIRPYGIHSYVQLDEDMLYVEGGGGVEFGVPLSDYAYLKVAPQLVYQKHGRQWADRDGVEFGTAASLTVEPLEGIEVDVSGWILEDDSVAAYEENREVAGFVSVGFRFDPRLPGVDGPLTVRPFAGAIRRRYDAPDPSIDPSTTRKDLDLRFGVVATLQIDETFSLQLSLSRTRQDSNLPNFEYSNNQAALSLSVSF